MYLMEQLIALVAPHNCLECDDEGSLLCTKCLPLLGPIPPSRCFLCRRVTENNNVCRVCRRNLPLKSVWVRGPHQGIAKQLLHAIKYSRAQAGCTIVARELAATLPDLADEYLIVPVPTANARRRQRGYDQAELVARNLSRELQLPYADLLMRVGASRQVGTTRAIRLKQLEGAFLCKDMHKLITKKVLLVDDVVTTGATLGAAAQTLYRAGYHSVSAVTFTQA